MRTASPQPIAMLNEDQFVMADLYTITTVQGEVIRATSYDFDLMVAGHTYYASGEIIKREGVSLSLGVEVDNLNVTIYATDDHTIGEIPIIKAFHNGQMDGARFKLERIFLNPSNLTNTSAGAVLLFEGRLIEPKFDRNRIEVSVASDLDDLAVQMPRNLYQPSCNNTLFDSACALRREDYVVNTVIESGSTTARILCSLSQPQGWFTQGVIEFLDDRNAGLKRTVRLHESGALLLTLPLLEAPQSGQHIKVYPGCDKRLETCINRFSNKDHFRGAPYVPVPETAV